MAATQQHRGRNESGPKAAGTMSLDDPASWPGPRTVNLKRCGDGFGFTLRHFIVYPPDSAVQEHLKFEAGGVPDEDREAGIRKKKSGKISSLEPMDTIFVKHVKEGGPAQQAGLNTGDRIVSVNAESVTGKTYSQVIALIQQSKENLQLLVVPKDEDVLQLAYQNSAYSGFRDPYRGSAAEIPSPPSLDLQANKSLARMQSASYASLRQQGLSASSELAAESTGSLSSARSRDSGGSSNSVDTAGNDARFKATKGEIPRRSSESALGKMVERFERIGEGQGYSPQERRGPLSQKVRFKVQDGNTVVDAAVKRIAAKEAADATSSQSVSMSTQTETKKQETEGSPRQEESFVRELRWAHRSSMHLKADHSRSSSEPVETSTSTSHLRHVGDYRRGGSPHYDKDDRKAVGHSLRRIEEGKLVYGSKESVSSVRSDPTTGIRVTTERGESGGKTIHIKIPKSQSVDIQAGYTPETSRKVSLGDVETRSVAKRIPVSSTTVAARTAQFETRVQKKTSTPTMQRHGSTDWEPKRYPLQGKKDSDQSQPIRAKMFVPETSDKKVDMTGIHYATRVRITSDGEIASIPDAAEKLNSREDLSGRKPSLVRKESYLHAMEASSARTAASSTGVKKTVTVSVRKSSSGGTSAVSSSSSAAPMEMAPSGIPAQATLTSVAGDHSTSSCSPSSDQTVVVLRERNINSGADQLRSTRRSSYLMATSPEADQLTPESEDVFSDKEHYTPQRMPSIRKLKSFFGENTPKIQEATEESLAVRRSVSTDSAPPTAADVIKEGWLNYRLSVNEKGKRVSGAKWKEAWAVLKGHMLYVCKERRVGSSMTVSMGDEHPISIKGSIPDIAYDYTKRKNVFRLLTHSSVNCVEYLFQAENHDDMLSWISAIQNNAAQDDEEAAGSRELILKRHTQYGDLLNPQAAGRAAPSPTIQLRGLTRRPKGPTPSPSTFRKPIKGPEDYVGAVKTKQNWKEWFRRLGPKTSSSPEPIGMFGVHLEECTPSGLNEYVPLIVELCCTIVEAKGLEVIGIYRIPGNSSGVAHLQEELNKGIENINLDDEKWGDTNIISSLLKSFFRKLPDPLVTNSMYGRFIEANRHKDSRKRMWALRELVHSLPDHHFETLKFLVGHLKKVASKSYINKMEVRNLAIVFGPTLVRTTQDNMAIMIQDMSDQCRIVESIIRHSDWFFDPEVDGKAIPVDPTDIDPVTSITQLLNGGGRVEEVEVRSAAIGDPAPDNTADTKKIDPPVIPADVNIQEIVRAVVGAAVLKQQQEQQQSLQEEQQTQLPHSYSDDEEGFSKDYFTRGIRLRRSFQPRKSNSSEQINLEIQAAEMKVNSVEELKTPSRHNSESSLDRISKATEQLDRGVANVSNRNSRKMHYYAVSKHQPYSPDLTRETGSHTRCENLVTRRPPTENSASRATFSLSQHYYSRYDLETRARQMKENYKRHKVIPDREYIERQHRQAIKDLENEEGGKEVVNDILSRSAQKKQIVIKLSDVTKEIAELSRKQDEFDDRVEKSLVSTDSKSARLDGNHPKADVASVTSDYSTTSSSNFATLESKRSTSSSYADTLNSRDEKRQRVSNNTSDSLSHQDSDLDSNLELDFGGSFDDHLKKLLDPDYDFPSSKKDSDSTPRHVRSHVPNTIYDRSDGRSASILQHSSEHRKTNSEISTGRSSRQVMNTAAPHGRTGSKSTSESKGTLSNLPSMSEQEMIARNAEEARRYRKKLKSKETEDIKGGRQRKSVRRRHTLGGGKDFPEYRSLTSLLSGDSKRDSEKRVSALERLKPQCASRELSLQGWIERERLRNSTPNLTSDSLSGGKSVEIVDIEFEGRARRISSPDLSDLKNRKFNLKSSKKDPHPQKLTKHVAKFYDIESYL